MSSRVVHITTVHQLRDPRIYRKQVPSLAAMGYEVHLIAKADASANQASGEYSEKGTVDSRFPDAVERTFVVHSLGTGLTGLPARLVLNWQAYRKALALRADVYHIHDPELLPVLRLLKLRTGARVIYDMHEDYGLRGGAAGRMLRALERWAFFWLDQVIIADDSQLPIFEGRDVPFDAVYNYPLAGYEHPGTPPESNHEVAARGAEPSADSKMVAGDALDIVQADILQTDMTPGFPDDVHSESASTVDHPAEPTRDFRLIYTGVLSTSRGLDHLISLSEAIDDAALPWGLDLVGVCYVDADRRAAEARLRDHGKVRSLRRIGWDRFIDAAVMTPYLRRASVGLILLHPHPNYVNVLPTKLYEYLQYGLPVLCSNFPRMAAFIEEYNCGAVVDPADSDSMISVLREWSQNPNLYSTLSSNARVASQKYQWAEMEVRLKQIYERLL